MLAKLKDDIRVLSNFDFEGECKGEFLPNEKYKVVSLNIDKTLMLIWCGEETVITSTNNFILLWESNHENT